jgi:hypothetical protein
MDAVLAQELTKPSGGAVKHFADFPKASILLFIDNHGHVIVAPS